MPLSTCVKKGYRYITLHDGKDTRKPLHRWLMEQAGRGGEVIHHINGDPLDNRLSNLTNEFTNSGHASYHSSKRIDEGVHTFQHLTPEQLDDTFSITLEITDYCYVNDCSVVGLEVGESVPVRELLYGTILPSGADAALGLATYVAGSQEAFVALMNEKLEELGLADTAHFTNCVGLFDESHKCTVSDMAVILEAAMDNDLCREVLGSRTYETAPTTDHPEGQILSNWFLRRIEDKDTGAITVTGAKTGYVVESGNCAASYGETADGHRYICVTADAASTWQSIDDHAALYRTYCSQEAPETAEAQAPVLPVGDTVPA